MQEETSIQVGGMTLMEPVSVFTDLLITALCTYIFIVLYRSLKKSRNWSLFFLCMGVSTFLGALSHGLKAEVSIEAYYSFWLTMQVLICIANYFAQKATLEMYFREHRKTGLFHWFFVAELFVFTMLVLYIRAFWVASLNTALTLIPVMIINIVNKERGGRASTFISGGIAVAFITALVHLQKISFHRWFNYKDIAHILIMISFYLMFLGIRSWDGSRLHPVKTQE